MFSGFGAELGSVGHHTDSPKIEPIRIPTGLDRNVGFRMPIGMQAAGDMKQIEIVIGERKILFTKLSRQFGTTLAMPIINAFADSPGVMENGKELDHFDIGSRFLGKPKANFQHPSPMRNAMCPIDGQGIFVENGVN